MEPIASGRCPSDVRESGLTSEHRSATRRGRSVPESLEPNSAHRLFVAGVALVLAAFAFIGVWRGFRPARIDRISDEAVQQPIDLDPAVAAVVSVGPQPTDVAIGEGAVWVSMPAHEPSRDHLIVRVDPATNEVVARIPVEEYVEEIAAGEGGVWGNAIEWAKGDPTFSLVRIDAVTNEVIATIPAVSGPLAVGDGAVWAVDLAGARAGPEGSTLLRVDRDTNAVAERISLGVAAWDIEFGAGFVWVLPLEPEPGEGDIVQVDPATNRVVAKIEIPFPDTGYSPTVYAPALGESSAWVPVCCRDDDLLLYRIDVATSAVVDEPITLPGGAPFAVAAGHVWFIEERGALYGLNLETLEVDEAVSGFDWPAGGFPDPITELDPDRLAVWVVNADQDSVTRIDLAPPSLDAGSALDSEGMSPVLSEGSEGSVTTFEPTEGWNVVQTSIDPSNRQDLPIVWAANVPFSSKESASGFPSHTVRNLPADGIVITVIGPREYTGDPVFPSAAFPLTISQGSCSHDNYETQPAPYVSKCLVDTMVGDELLNVTMWFGMNFPSDEMYERANAELARLVLPET